MKKQFILSLVAALALTSGAALAAGYNHVTQDGIPVKWDTSRGSIPVYTDGGGTFTYNEDGVTPFLTVERANEITQFAFDQWSNVPTSTLQAGVAGTIESMTGIADVTGQNADQIYFQENGYGIWVLYDTDASILEQFFGVSRYSTLGIAFPEIALEDGTIIEATAVLNGWNVDINDVNGERVAGVFTHEFGHTLNLAHSQVNGHMAYYSSNGSLYPGVPGCVDPVTSWDSTSISAPHADPWQIETMYPIIAHTTEAGRAMSYVSTRDDMVSLSNLYPTADYLAGTGTITGTLYLKDGVTDFSGINVVARNVNDPMGDAVSALTGHESLGEVRHDGRFTLRGLTPGADYVIYTEQILTGGFPVPKEHLYSVPEYWNAKEGTDPVADNPCDATPIRAEAGVIQTADLYFNGYTKGVDFTPLGSFYFMDLAKDGKSALGYVGQTPFIWDEKKGFTVIPGAKANQGAMSKDGQTIAITADVDGNGIVEPTIWTPKKGLRSLGHLGATECAGDSDIGQYTGSSLDISDDGKVVVGLAYDDKNGDGNCQSQGVDPVEILGFVWTEKTGMQELPSDGLGRPIGFIRAHGISGNGKVILGTNRNREALAWVDGKLVDLYSEVGAISTNAANYAGTRVALETRQGAVLWNPTKSGDEAFQNIGGLKWCEDVDYVFFGTNYCELLDPEYIQSALGPITLRVTEMTDDGKVMVGIGGDFFSGYVGGIWMEPLGWMTMNDFLSRQGVVEADLVSFNGPYTISASGTEISGGIVGAQYTWKIDLDQVYVCEHGVSNQTGFSNGLFEKVAEGAEFGRCEHIE